MSTRVSDVEARYGKADVPQFDVGDRVSVAVLIREISGNVKGKAEEKTRIQNFIGDVIAIQGSGLGRAFTVRRVVQGEGVERTFPLHSPLTQGVKAQRKGIVRRAKLYDLREKSGKAARIRERQGHTGGTATPDDHEPLTEQDVDTTSPADATETAGKA